MGKISAFNEVNFVSVPLDRYEELLLAENQLELAKQIIFNCENRLNYNKKAVNFVIDDAQVRLVFPCDHHLHLLGLQKEEEDKNV